MDRKDLKIQALLEKVSSLTTQHENTNADLRVELTMVSNERDQLQSRVSELEQEVARYEEATDKPAVSDE